MSDIIPTCSCLNASKLLTSGNRFLYSWQYSSINFTVGRAALGCVIGWAGVSAICADYTFPRVTQERYRKAMEEYIQLLMKVIEIEPFSQGELIIKWQRKIKNKGNAVVAN